MKDLRSLTDRELADLQSDYKTTTAEWRLCQQEFIRRQGIPAARRSWIAIWISVGALAMSGLAAFLAYVK